MAKFCTQCGTPIADPANALCDACLALKQQTATFEPNSAPRPNESAEQWRSYADLAQEALLKPSSAFQSATRFGHAIPGLMMAAVGSVVTALIAVAFVRQIMNSIFGAISLGFGSYSDYSFPYGSTFFKLLILLLLQWVILSMLITGVARLFKQNISPVQSLNIVGLTKLYIAAGAIVAYILHFVLSSLGAAVLTGVFIAGYIAIERAIRPLLKPQGETFYLLPAAAGLQVFCSWLLLKIFF